jgi:hypothetical protein
LILIFTSPHKSLARFVSISFIPSWKNSIFFQPTWKKFNLYFLHETYKEHFLCDFYCCCRLLEQYQGVEEKLLD